MTRPPRASLLLGITVALGCAAREPDSDPTHTTSTGPIAATTSSTAVGATDSAAPTSTSGTTAAPCNFLNCDDYPKPECSTWAQDCPEGQKCAAYIAGGGSAWDAVKCVELTGTDEPGDPCTSEGAVSGVDSCSKGAMCWHLDKAGAGTCVALCTGSPEAPICPPKTTCPISSSGILNLCLPTCDPLLQDCPNPVEGCYPFNAGLFCAADASGDAGQANDPCVYINSCDPGLMCADAALVGAGCEPGSTGCCTPFCKFPDGACPNPDQQCVQYFAEPFPPLPESAEHIGVCGVPG